MLPGAGAPVAPRARPMQTWDVKPFLLLASRAEDAAAEDEYRAYLRYTGLEPEQLHRIRMEAAPLPELDLTSIPG